MCPIREFEDDPIRFVDSYLYFVFAVDAKCRLKIFLLDEKDLENDDDTMVVWDNI